MHRPASPQPDLGELRAGDLVAGLAPRGPGADAVRVDRVVTGDVLRLGVVEPGHGGVDRREVRTGGVVDPSPRDADRRQGVQPIPALDLEQVVERGARGAPATGGDQGAPREAPLVGRVRHDLLDVLGVVARDHQLTGERLPHRGDRELLAHGAASASSSSERRVVVPTEAPVDDPPDVHPVQALASGVPAGFSGRHENVLDPARGTGGGAGRHPSLPGGDPSEIHANRAGAAGRRLRSSRESIGSLVWGGRVPGRDHRSDTGIGRRSYGLGRGGRVSVTVTLTATVTAVLVTVGALVAVASGSVAAVHPGGERRGSVRALGRSGPARAQLHGQGLDPVGQRRQGLVVLGREALAVAVQGVEVPHGLGVQRGQRAVVEGGEVLGDHELGAGRVGVLALVVREVAGEAGSPDRGAGAHRSLLVSFSTRSALLPAPQVGGSIAGSAFSDRPVSTETHPSGLGFEPGREPLANSGVHLEDVRGGPSRGAPLRTLGRSSRPSRCGGGGLGRRRRGRLGGRSLLGGRGAPFLVASAAHDQTSR